MKIFLLFYLFILSQISFPQHDSLKTDNYLLILKEKQLKVFEQDKIIFKKQFNNPFGYTSDLNDDGTDEYLVIDSLLQNKKPIYTLYIFNLQKDFSLIDSIISGSMEPYETNSGDLGGTIIISGNPDFEQFNNNDENYFLPLNCWRYEDSALFLVNDEVYNIFLNENENIIDFLDDSFGNNKTCDISQSMLGAIASAYANYVNAGEKSVASQFLKNYYLCTDINQFKQKLDALLKGTE